MTNQHPFKYLALLLVLLNTIFASTAHAVAGDVVQTTTASYTYDSYGNLTLNESTTTVTEPTGTKVYNQKNINNYANMDVANWRLGLLSCQLVWSSMPSDSQLLSSDLATATATTYGYFVDAPRYGLLQSQNVGVIAATTAAPTICSAPTTFISNTYTYDSLNVGNLTSTTVTGADFASRSTSQTYDASNRFVKTKTNELGQTETITYDFEETNLPARGLVTRQKGPNLLETKWEYDELGRKTKEIRPDGTYTVLTYANCSTDCESSEAYKTTSTNYRANGSIIDAADISYYDRFDRAVRSKTTSFDSKTLITGKKVYNNLGQVVETYSSHSLPLAATDSLNNYKTTIGYDALGRPYTTTESSGRTTKVSYTHSFETTTTIYPTTNTNATGQKKTERKNGLGRLVEVIDNANNSLKYVYDVKGNLRKTIDALGNVTQIEYNALGQKTKMIDPNMGTWTYGYNLLGELLTQLDAKAKSTTMTYDKLGRMLTRTEADLTSTWTYDTASKGIGKITSETSSNGYSRSYSYDSLGRNSAVTTTMDGISYTTSNTYDDAGRPNSFIYPTSVGYKNVYDANGYLSEVRDTNNAALYWKAIKRDSDGHVLEEQLGNGLTTKRTYKPTTGYIDTIQTGVTAASFTATVQNDSYTFDSLGNLTFRNEALNNVAESFGYDTLNRLTSATRGSDVRSVKYDALGRIYYKSEVGYYSYGQAITVPNPSYNPNWTPYNTWIPIGMGNGTPIFVSGPVTAPSQNLTVSTAGVCGGIHRVCGIAGTLNTTFAYDANGNMISGNGRNYTWMSFNMPASITQGGNSESFLYNANHERIKRTSVDNGQTTTTYYLNPRLDLGGTFEKNIKPNNSVEYVHHIYAGGQAIGSVVTTDNYSAPTPQWTTDLSVAPTTVSPNSVGITLPSGGFVTWEADGKLAMRNKANPTTAYPGLYGQRTYSPDSNLLLRYEITPTTNSNQSMSIGLANNGAWGTDTYRRYVLQVVNNMFAVRYYVKDSNSSAYSLPYVNLGAIQANTTYVVEIESTANVQTMYVYPKGQSRATGYRHAVDMNWPAGYNKRLWSEILVTPTTLDSVVYLDNLSESSFIAQGTRYFHTDHLGSISAVTNAAGNVVERFSYDAWGKRRATTGADASGIKSSSTKHGFTGHESLDTIGLVHMNGRVYDPVVGRFVSADPFIDGIKDLQGFNRYSYVLNNPLSFTDPSGYNVLKKLFKAAVDSVKAYFVPTPKNMFKWVHEMPGMNKVEQEVMRHKYGPALVQAGCSLVAGSVGAGACSGYFAGLAGGDNNDMFKAAFTSFVTYEISAAVNGYIGDSFTTPMSNTLAHGVWGGVESVAQGGDFKSGFVSGLTGGIYDNYFNGFGGAGGSIIVGGLSAELSGGDPALGAMTALMSYEYNMKAHRRGALVDGSPLKDDLLGGMGGYGRRGAFNEAKQDLGIPRTQQPTSVERVPLTDRNKQPILRADGQALKSREYHYIINGKRVVIQNHSAGHYYGKGDKGNQGSHFNVRPIENTRTGKVPGTKEHYSW